MLFTDFLSFLEMYYVCINSIFSMSSTVGSQSILDFLFGKIMSTCTWSCLHAAPAKPYFLILEANNTLSKSANYCKSVIENMTVYIYTQIPCLQFDFFKIYIFRTKFTLPFTSSPTYIHPELIRNESAYCNAI